MLSLEIEDRLGYLPHGIFHSGWDLNPVLRFVAAGLGSVTADGPSIAAAVAKGEHIIVTPGGSLEATRRWGSRYRVRWGVRMGYLKLAIKYRLPIVPVAAAGVDDAYLGLLDGYAWGRRLRLPFRADLTLFAGIGGLWPFALPLPVKFRQRIGAAIELPEDLRPDDKDQMTAWHGIVTARVQSLLDGLTENGQGDSR
jgi:hypothetical protein